MGTYLYLFRHEGNLNTFSYKFGILAFSWGQSVVNTTELASTMVGSDTSGILDLQISVNNKQVVITGVNANAQVSGHLLPL